VASTSQANTPALSAVEAKQAVAGPPTHGVLVSPLTQRQSSSTPHRRIEPAYGAAPVDEFAHGLALVARLAGRMEA